MKIKKASEKIANKRNCTNACTPMIFEGDPGQGKQNATEYVCKDL